MKAFIIINLINFLLSLSVTIFYVYPKSDSLFICLFFFMGFLYLLRNVVEQLIKIYGKSVK